MSTSLLVSHEVVIHAAPEKVWEVLIHPHFIRQWDDVPEDFGQAPLTLGSVMEWPGYAKLTVAEFELAERS
ncbi:hypothetical protein P4U99_21440 [Brevibacillus agri]|uniref:hypothetical protein n=1 Tax=Brevibacillus agri TaxID=51101 RepID=UPI000472CA0F|nr:hypothetical protein [Brevibacillus agri]MCG5251846.1 hypothetical protein [Brevibacillus agri]MDR9507373.1 hypothetical protein [Brevibacillus agri]MED1645714.1 hypothetical protein [Brevibacillus agri]MED1652874.1 hypothetical protein [Brevibacillus agri]MED1686985.1 hypothetical protein [Brevibacillus agri]